MFVRGVVVDNRVKLQVLQRLFVDLIQKLQQFLIAPEVADNANWCCTRACSVCTLCTKVTTDCPAFLSIDRASVSLSPVHSANDFNP